MRLLVVTLVMAWGCGGPCIRNSDCPGMLVCMAGECAMPIVEMDADVPDGELGDAFSMTDGGLDAADMMDADMTDADMTDADMMDADMTDADMTDADMMDATDMDADMMDADMMDAGDGGSDGASDAG